MILLKVRKKLSLLKKIAKRKRDREPSRIPVHRVIKLLKRKKCRSSIQYLMKRNFPSSSLIRSFCSNYKKWFIWFNCEHFYFKYVYFINKQKGNKLCTCQQERSSNKMLRGSHFSHHCNYHISHCLNLKGAMPPRNDSCNLSWAAV